MKSGKVWFFYQAGFIEQPGTMFPRKVDVVSDRVLNPHLQQIIISEALP
jgi:hypothetical protein